MTEEYYKVEGLAPLAAFTGTLDLGSTKIGDPEAAADLFAYDGPHGPMGAAQLASTVLQAAPVKGAAGVVPLAGGPIYVTVEGWLISSPPYDGRRLTSDGASYKVGVTTP
jgi:hypothetical protein